VQLGFPIKTEFYFLAECVNMRMDACDLGAPECKRDHTAQLRLCLDYRQMDDELGSKAKKADLENTVKGWKILELPFSLQLIW